jgi:hypothetical protein
MEVNQPNYSKVPRVPVDLKVHIWAHKYCPLHDLTPINGQLVVFSD